MAAPTRHVRITRPTPPLRDHLPLGEPTGSPDAIQVTSRFIERDGRPWFPITGEIHFSRIPRERWDEMLRKARAGGLTSVATYVFWQAHEPSPGEFRWDGNRDLRAFIETAAAAGLEVVVRLGPWAHGEARYGGFPDWVVERGIPTRTNDPRYLELVDRLYGQLIAQLTGLTRADGGPIVGVQVDNELYDQPQHLAELRRIAERHGLTAPIWTATGWGGAQVPETLLPVYSAYADGFWEESDVEWAPFAAFHFRYSPVRDDLSVGKDLREALDKITLAPGEVALKDDDALPFATCELGGGMHVAYHRRPLVAPADISALALAKIGSGSIWQGYYMYGGGTQRVGPHGTEQESQATGYPNDVPTRSYDFHAPIGEYGQLRPHYHQLRRQHLWLDTDGEALAAMTTTVGGGSEDPAELRWAVRSDGQRGYLFLTTYQPAKQPLPAQPGVQVEVEFDGGTLTVPSAPVDLPAGISVAWPLNFPLTDALTLRSATAQVVTRFDDLLVLSATPGVPVELVLDRAVGVSGPVQSRPHGDGVALTLTAEPGPECLLGLPGVQVLVLSEADADRFHRLPFQGREYLVLTDAAIYPEGDGLVLHPEAPSGRLLIHPAPAELGTDGASLTRRNDAGIWGVWEITADAGSTRLVEPTGLLTATAPPARRGGPTNRLSAPTDFSGAATVPVQIPDELFTGTDRLLLRVSWTGDVGRAVLDGEVISDHFWHGRVWDIDLTPHRQRLADQPLELQLLPWVSATGVWVDPSVRDIPDGVSINAIDALRIPRITIR